MKIKMFFITLFIALSIVGLGSVFAKDEETIDMTRADDPTAVISYKGTTKYYNPDNQKWKRLKNATLYEIKGKLDLEYYKPFEYLTPWVAKDKSRLKITVAKTYSKTTSEIVSATINVSTTQKLAEMLASISANYTATFNYSSSVKYTHVFNMKRYSKNRMYRPALFGRFVKYNTIKVSKIKKNSTSSYGPAYAVIDKDDVDLRLAYK